MPVASSPTARWEPKNSGAARSRTIQRDSSHRPVTPKASTTANQVRITE